jgi:hypothetical protein
MITAQNQRRVHPGAAIAAALLSIVAFAMPALAGGGNSAASAACENGGYANWTTAEGATFRNAGGCVSYAAHGGTLVPVVVDVDPFSVVYGISGTNGFSVAVTGSGLEPFTGVDVFVAWGSLSQFVDAGIVDASGNLSSTVTAACTSMGSGVTEVSVVGIAAGGEQTAYPFPVPDATVCP